MSLCEETKETNRWTNKQQKIFNNSVFLFVMNKPKIKEQIFLILVLIDRIKSRINYL